MEDSVKFIFKTLIKVPVIIAIAYVIFNIFAFCFIYFKMLGASYIVMQTAVENNYLPSSELTTLHNYVSRFNDIEMIDGAAVVVGNLGGDLEVFDGTNFEPTIPETPGSSDARRRTQYGHNVTVGVTCRYLPVWPLQHGKVNGMNDDGTDLTEDLYLGDPTTDTTAPYNTDRNNITITYNVPGLKYYPDLVV